VLGIFHCLNPSSHTLALRSCQPLNRNEYQEYLLGGKGSRCIGLTTCHLHVQTVLEILEASTSCNPKGLSRHVTGCQFKHSSHLQNQFPKKTYLYNLPFTSWFLTWFLFAHLFNQHFVHTFVLHDHATFLSNLNSFI